MEPLLDGEVSTLLRAWSKGDQHALEKLTPIVYDELRRLAAHDMRGERSGHSLQTTGPGQRSLRATGGLQTHAMAEPRPLLRRLRPIDETHSGGARAPP